MTVTSAVLIQDPHSPRDVFAAACQAAGSSPETSDFYDFDDACMLMAREQGAEARVSVHYADTDLGGRTTALYPREEDGTGSRPDCYSVIHLTTGAFAGNDEVWQHHAGLVRKLGPLLGALGLRWSWRLDDDGGPWLSYVPASRADSLAPELGRRTARTATAPGPADVWRPLITATGEFDPENDAALLAWMAGEAGGMTGYAEGLAAAYETAVVTVGLDPVALQSLHDCGEAAAFAAEQMAAARQKFAAHYAEVRQFAAGGGVLPFNGRWMTGEGS
jgi:hypothetical protein